MRIYSDHTRGRVRIVLAGIEGSGRLAIYNLQGKVVYSTTVKDEQTVVVNKPIKSGVYLIALKSKGKTVFRKVAIP